MIHSWYENGYYTHNGNIGHAQIRSSDGFRVTTYSPDMLRLVRKAKGLDKRNSIKHIKHPYIGKTFIDYWDNQEKTVVEVWEHFGFGNYFIAVYINYNNGSHGTFTLKNEGTGIEKFFRREETDLIESQLEGAYAKL